MWHDLSVALALLLVMEGILPFLRPQGWRRIMSVVTQQSDEALRIFGLTCMLVGVGLLYVVR